MILYHKGNSFVEQAFALESDLEQELVANAKLLFGESSVYIDVKRKIEAKALGGTIPDGFLFDLSDPDNAEFYLVEAELFEHDFFRHIFPQITKFFAFFKNNSSQANLIEKIYSIVNSDASLRSEFARHIGSRELYKFIKDTVENSQNILIVIDKEKKELPEIMDTYSDTWGKLVKLMTFRRFVNGEEVILVAHPEFDRIEIPAVEEDDAHDQEGATEYSEEYHLEDVSEVVKTIYHKLKEEALNINATALFNPQKYYLSIKCPRNIAFFSFRKKKLHLTVPLPEERVRELIRHNTVKRLSDGVQRFWGSGKPWCKIVISSTEALDEVVGVLKEVLPESN